MHPKWELISSDICQRLSIIVNAANECGHSMEMNMHNIHEHDDGVIELGVASVDTRGSVTGDLDAIGLQLKNMGIADD